MRASEDKRLAPIVERKYVFNLFKLLLHRSFSADVTGRVQAILSSVSGADPEPQDRGCSGDINEIAININTKSAYRIASDTSPFLVWVVVHDGWKRRVE